MLDGFYRTHEEAPVFVKQVGGWTTPRDYGNAAQVGQPWVTTDANGLLYQKHHVIPYFLTVILFLGNDMLFSYAPMPFSVPETLGVPALCNTVHDGVSLNPMSTVIIKSIKKVFSTT